MEEQTSIADQGSDQSSEGQAGRAAGSGAEGAWSDREIKETGQDRFSFRDYAGVLARRASTADTPLTIGIYGRWGSGKSSLMGLTEEALGEEKKKGVQVHCIWINVWQLSSQDEVWQAFLQALFSEVQDKVPFRERVDWQKLRKQVLVSLGRFFLVAAPLLIAWWVGSSATDLETLADDAIAAGGVAASVGLLLLTAARIGPIVEAFRQTWKVDLKGAMKYGHYDEKISELRRLQGRFEKLVCLRVGSEGRLVVFIDDLDRCTPDTVPEVLEAIKLFTTTPRCVYLIGLDRDIVRQGIQARYKFETTAAATEYLEKIVQVPFHLPPLDLVRIEEFVLEYYEDLQGDPLLDLKAVAEVFSEGLEPNPRKVKRALNIYRTLRDLAEARVRAWEMDPVDPVLLAKMVVIESRFRPLHEYLKRDTEFLLAIEDRLAAEQMLDVEEDKRDTEQASQVLKDDDTVGPALFGAPKTEDADARPALLEEADVPAFIRMLWVGKRHFTDEDQRGQISSYIYLTGTSEGGAEQVRPNRREREALLRGERAEIRGQVEEILERGADEAARQQIIQIYIERLEVVLDDVERYTAVEQMKAGIALSLFELPLWGETDESRQARMAQLRGEELSPEPAAGEDEALAARLERIKRRLMPVLDGSGFYDGGQLLTANLALDLLEGFSRQDFEPQTMRIPAGGFVMGATDEQVKQLIAGGMAKDLANAEAPQHPVDLDAYRLGRYPVTNAEYRVFVQEALHEPPEHWADGQPPEGKEDHPVVYVTWHDAVAYCGWLSQATGRDYRLPSEADWEKAARGHGRIYPWGDQFAPALANTKEAGVGDTSAVGAYPGGASPLGLLDMGGNVWEWTRSLWGENPGRPEYVYPYRDDDGREDMEAPDSVIRVVRGGSYGSTPEACRCSFRSGRAPTYSRWSGGFRVAASPFFTSDL